MTESTPPQPFKISIPRIARNGELDIALRPGEPLFVVGPNGSGKSALAAHLAATSPQPKEWVQAHRNILLGSDELNWTEGQLSQIDHNLTHYVKDKRCRWAQVGNFSDRHFRALNRLRRLDHTRKDKLFFLVRSDPERAHKESKNPLSIEILNNIMKSAGFFVEVMIDENQKIMARRDMNSRFSGSQLSDGERAALILAAEVLAANPSSLLIIDEPERHLHRAISAPLLAALFAERRDCAFVVFTHDLSLVTAHPGSRVVILRDCRLTETGQDDRWDADLLAPTQPMPDDVLEAILGARRVILFVEGNDTSLDRRVAEALFPGITVVPRGGCEDVIRAVESVRSLRATEPSAAWIEAFGLIDRDARRDEHVESLFNKGVYALAVSAIESVVFHPAVIEAVAKRQADHLGDDGQDLRKAALGGARDILRAARDRLIGARCEQRLPQRLLRAIDTKEAGFWSRERLCIEGLPVALRAEEEAAFPTDIGDDDLPRLVARYPVKAATGLGKAVATALRFRHENDFLDCALQALRTDEGLRATVRGLFGDLAAAIDAALKRPPAPSAAAGDTCAATLEPPR